MKFIIALFFALPAQAKTTIVACEGLGLGRYAARGVVLPLADLYKFDFIANQWFQGCPALPAEGKLIVLMHSMGGGCFNCLRATKRPVDLVVAMDVRVTGAPYAKPPNVKRLVNYYQRGWWLPGNPVAGADFEQRVSVGHTSIPFLPEIQDQVARVLK